MLSRGKTVPISREIMKLVWCVVFVYARDINKNNFGSLLRAAFPGKIVAKKRRVNYEGGKTIAPAKKIHLPNISSCKNRWFQ